MIQLLKNLSYQRYEGSPATTGFLVYRNQLDDFLGSLQKAPIDWIDLGDDRRRISGDFFRNPLSYRFVDGYQGLFICDISMNVKGPIRTRATAASHFGSVIKVSEDGPLELFRDGRSIYRFG